MMFKVNDYIIINSIKSNSSWYHNEPMKILNIGKNTFNKKMLFVDIELLRNKINPKIYSSWENYNGIAAELVINITNEIRKKKLKNII